MQTAAVPSEFKIMLLNHRLEYSPPNEAWKCTRELMFTWNAHVHTLRHINNAAIPPEILSSNNQRAASKHESGMDTTVKQQSKRSEASKAMVRTHASVPVCVSNLY
jgi:hypothetical protein